MAKKNYRFLIHDHGFTKSFSRGFEYDSDATRFARYFDRLTRWEVFGIFCDTGRIY